MDEIEKRLRETSENCYNCYEDWLKNKKDQKAREALSSSVHELRKVASRLEIELAVSERDDVRQKPIPIPSHRDANRRPRDNGDDNRGNNGGSDNRSDSKPKGRRRPQSNKSKD